MSLRPFGRSAFVAACIVLTACGAPDGSGAPLPSPAITSSAITAPTTPPVSVATTTPAAPSTVVTDDGPPDALVGDPGSRLWGDEVALLTSGATPGFEFVVVMRPGTYQRSVAGTERTWRSASLPVVIASGAVAADGTVDVRFTIPVGMPPGEHDLAVYDANSSDHVMVVPIFVEAPPECTTEGHHDRADVDQDGVADNCDPTLFDGMVADWDGDGVLNTDDNCVTVPNPDQAATSAERSVGKVCDARLGVDPHSWFVDRFDAPPLDTAPEVAPAP